MSAVLAPATAGAEAIPLLPSFDFSVPKPKPETSTSDWRVARIFAAMMEKLYNGLESFHNVYGNPMSGIALTLLRKAAPVLTASILLTYASISVIAGFVFGVLLGRAAPQHELAFTNGVTNWWEKGVPSELKPTILAAALIFQTTTLILAGIWLGLNTRTFTMEQIKDAKDAVSNLGETVSKGAQKVSMTVNGPGVVNNAEGVAQGGK